MKPTHHPSLRWLLALVSLLLLIITFSALRLQSVETGITPTPWIPASVPTLYFTTSPTPGWWEALPTAQPLTPEN